MGEQSQDDSPVPGGQAADLVLVQGGQLLAVGEPVLIVVSMTPPASCESGDSLPNPNPRRALGGARRGRQVTRSRRLRVRGRARPGTFRERVDPCQHCGPRHDERMRTASAATFRVDRALSLPPAARLRAFYRRHAAARSKAAAAGSRGSRARCIRQLSRARSWGPPWKRPPTRGAPS